MPEALVGGIGIILLLVLILAGTPIGLALLSVGFAGFAWLVSPEAALTLLADEIFLTLSSYSLAVLPLFFLMGQLAYQAGMSGRLFSTAYTWLGHLPGGLAMAAVGGCAGFSAISGSNTATAATMSTVALPEMKKYGYNPELSTSSVAVGATLGVVIPPSVVLIIIGLQTGQSIAKLFWAAVIPGIVLTMLFLLTVLVLCRLHPDWGPAGPPTAFKDKLRSLPGSIEMVVLFFLVMGGLFAGFFTPSEAGAAGSMLAVLISLITGKLNFERFANALSDTVRVSCMILMIVAGAVVFGKFLAVTRLPFAVADWTVSLDIPNWVVILLICAVYGLGGMIMDALALLLITIPIFFPVAEAMGYDPVWFGVLITVVTTMGAATPPVGVNLFIVSSMSRGVAMHQIFRGITYFLASYALLIVLMLLFPGMALYLPALIR